MIMQIIRHYTHLKPQQKERKKSVSNVSVSAGSLGFFLSYIHAHHLSLYTLHLV